jgi:hypothetical protein
MCFIDFQIQQFPVYLYSDLENTEMHDAENNRRSFLTRAAGFAAGGLALLFTPFGKIAKAGERIIEDDLETHGPVRQAIGSLKLPAAPDAARLFAPYHHGDIFKRRWAIAHVAHGARDQIVLVLVDINSGGHAELEVFATDPEVKPVAGTERYSVILDNGAKGDEKTPQHICDLADALAGMIEKNENRVDLTWRVPTVRTAPMILRRPPEAHESYGDLSG